jgi:hypothetical protein
VSHELSARSARSSAQPHDRRHERALCDCPVQLGFDGGSFPGTLREISEGGLRLETAAPLAEGANLRLSFALERWPDWRLAGRVVRRRGAEAGVALERIRPREMLLIRHLVWRAHL